MNMEKKQIVLKSGRVVNVTILVCEDGEIKVDADVEISQEEADELFDLI